MSDAELSSIPDDVDLGQFLETPDDWSSRHDAVRRVDEALASSASGQTAGRQAILDLRDLSFDEIATLWSPQAPYPLMWPGSWYIPVDADWRVFGPQLHQPPDSRRYARDWTTASRSEQNDASRRDGRLSAYVASRPDDPHLTSESGIGVIYSPTFALGTVRVVPEVACAGTLRTRLDMDPMTISGAVRVSASVVVIQAEFIPNGLEVVRRLKVPVATTYWVDRSHGENWESFTATPRGSKFRQQFLVEHAKRYLFGIVAVIETWSTLRNSDTGERIHRFDGNVFNLWGQHNAVVSRVKITTVNRYLP